MALGQRLKVARLKAGLTQGQLGSKVGMTQAAIGALEKRDSRQSAKAAELARALNVSLEWLMSGKEPRKFDVFEKVIEVVAKKHRRPDEAGKSDREVYERVRSEWESSEEADDRKFHEYLESIGHYDDLLEIEEPISPSPPEGDDELEFIGHMDAWDSNTPLDPDEVELPLFREVELAAGAGQTQVIENHGAKLRFAKSTLSRAGVEQAHAACAFVRGNSMEPVMPDGTCVGVNTGDTAIRDGEIYAIDHDGMLRVKYLHRRPGGGIKIVSQNAAEHATEEYSAQAVIDNNIRVIGRVFWWSVLR